MDLVDERSYEQPVKVHLGNMAASHEVVRANAPDAGSCVQDGVLGLVWPKTTTHHVVKSSYDFRYSSGPDSW